MDPASMMLGGAVLGSVGTLFDTGAGMSEADAEARVAKKNAAAVSAQAGQNEDAQRRSNRDFLGRQRAAIAESGIGFGGSSQVLQEQTAAELELDALNIRYEGELKRRGLKSEAQMATARKKAIGVTGFLLAGSQLLGGASNASAYNASRIPGAT